MKNIIKARYGSIATGALALALVGTAAAPATAGAAANCPARTSKALLKANAKAEAQAKKLIGDTSYTPVVRTFRPEPTSTKKFTGYETITVNSPEGTGPVVGYFSLSGGEACSVLVTSAQVVQGKNAYVVKLEFPGEQGNPGKLKVTLVSR